MTWRLSEQPDAVGVASARIEEASGIPAAHVEKDFWVTEALRAAATQAEAEEVTMVFKGGTSLSKAHGLLNRFSEDVDLIVVVPADSKGAADRCLKKITSAVGLAQGDVGVVDEATTTKGRKRTTRSATGRAMTMRCSAVACSSSLVRVGGRCRRTRWRFVP